MRCNIKMKHIVMVKDTPLRAIIKEYGKWNLLNEEVSKMMIYLEYFEFNLNHIVKSGLGVRLFADNVFLYQTEKSQKVKKLPKLE